MVGFKDEETKLLGYLMDEKEKLDVISIIGMPGLGKTTLARKIFENEQVCYEFPVRIWVYVSHKFNRRDVFLNILRKFTSNDMSDLNDEELTQSVRACLSNEKFLLVMDDVWRPEDWQVIQTVLPSSNNLSKVMITSRLSIVGESAKVGHFTEPHNLRFFNLEESWELLQLVVFGNEEDCFPELVDTGMKIADQCHGVLLTIVVVGGILVDLFAKTRVPRRLKRLWDDVSHNISKFVKNDKEKHISEALELSYQTLPNYLKECFLYIAVFPEEHVIPAWKLTRLWIAEGFVLPKGRSLEEATEQNLRDLVSRNLLMVDRKNLLGEIKTCRVHDMIREFCKDIAVEHKLFHEIRKNKGVFEPPVSEVQKFHRLCFHSDLPAFFSRKPKGPHVHSFLCFYNEPVNLEDKYLTSIPDAFELLRVLESISIRYRQFPAKVTKLIHLRYITLLIEKFSILPEPLSQLWNLQTLVIETKSRSITMKANIWKMYHLRHLKLNAAIVLDPKWDGEGGENLQTLSRLAPESYTTKVSERACNLIESRIRGKLATLFSAMSMENMGLLEKLKLKLMNDAPTNSEPLPRLPRPNSFPPNLKRLTLSKTFRDWEHMSTLAEIKSLEVLKLKDNAFIGTSWNASASVFDNLQVLVIIDANIVHWLVSASSFCLLSCLVLKNCDKLIHIPFELGKKLELLEIELIQRSAIASAKRIEEVKRGEQVRFKLQMGPGCWIKPNYYY